MAAINARHDKLVQEIGRAGVHALFPNDFEFYMIMLELVDSIGKTIDFLAFPVAPEKLNYEDPRLVNIKKSLGGISSLDTETFAPKTITMSGTFGRKFKLLIGKPTTSAENNAKSSDSGFFEKEISEGLNIKRQVFDPKYKTGYGVLKILESIVNKSSGLDLNGEPYRLYLYNPSLNHSFLVKINKFTMSQDKNNSNMMWRYDLMMTAIAPIQSLRDKAKEELSDLMDSAKLKVKSLKAARQIKNQVPPPRIRYPRF